MSTTVDEEALEASDGNSGSTSGVSASSALFSVHVVVTSEVPQGTLCTWSAVLSESVQAPDDNKAVCSAAGELGTDDVVFSTGVRTGEGGTRTGTTLISEDVGVKVPWELSGEIWTTWVYVGGASSEEESCCELWKGGGLCPQYWQSLLLLPLFGISCTITWSALPLSLYCKEKRNKRNISHIIIWDLPVHTYYYCWNFVWLKIAWLHCVHHAILISIVHAQSDKLCSNKIKFWWIVWIIPLSQQGC